MKTNLNKFYVSSLEDNVFKYIKEGVTFNLTHAGRGNKSYTSYAIIRLAKHEGEKSKMNTEDKAKFVLAEAQDSLVDNLLVGWSGLIDDTGKEIPFSKAKAKELFDMLPDLADELFFEAQKNENYINEKK